MATPRICSISGCNKPHFNKGWCAFHFARWRDRGDPLSEEKIIKICSISDCDKPIAARGFCDRHYRRWSQYGDPLGCAPVRAKRKCSFPACNRPHEAHGLCSLHYARKKSGRPLDAALLTKAGEPSRFFREVVCTYEGDECLIWPYSRNDAGYGKFYHEGRLQQVHRMVCANHNGPAPSPIHEAAHRCGNGHLGCCTKKHLLWKTPKENSGDQVAHGTRRYGERHKNSKLTEADVRQIRAMQGTATQRKIAAMFNTSAANIGLIHSRQRWRWLK